MKKPQAIYLYFDSLNELDMLSDEQTGRLLKALLRYGESGETPDFSDDKALMLVFSVMSRKIDRDFEKYAQICEKRKEAGRKGGAPKGNANASKQPKQPNASKTSQAESETETEAESETETYTETETEAHSAPSCQAGLTGDILIVDEIIDYLNRKAGTHFRATAKSAQRCITALLNDGYTADDLKKAVDNKCRDWKGTEYARYLRPETLFGEKFDSYLNSPSGPSLPKRKKGDPWYEQDYMDKIRDWANHSMFDD